MPVIPVYESQTGVPAAALPRPGPYVSPLAVALESAAVSFGKVVEQQQIERERLRQASEAAWVTQASADADLSWRKKLAEMSEAVPTGQATGFADRFNTEFESWYQDQLRTAPSEEARLALQGRLLGVRNSLYSTAASWENGTVVAEHGARFEGAFGSLSQLAATTGDIDSAIARFNQDLAIADATWMDGATVERWRIEGPTKIQTAWLQGLVLRDPNAAAAALGMQPTPAALTGGSMAMPALIDSMIPVESGGKSDAVSPKGAVGLMQVMPATARAMASELGMTDVAQMPEPALIDWLKVEDNNLLVGGRYLDKMLKRYGGNQTLALAAYNAGPGAVDEWLARIGDPRSGAVTDAQFAAAIPYAETRTYVGKVLAGAGGSGAGFDAFGTGYDDATAMAAGLTRDATGHMGSVAPVPAAVKAQLGLPEESYLLLKGQQHPTWDKAVAAEEARGFKVLQLGDRFYSVPKDWSAPAAAQTASLHPALATLPVETIAQMRGEVSRALAEDQAQLAAVVDTRIADESAAALWGKPVATPVSYAEVIEAHGPIEGPAIWNALEEDRRFGRDLQTIALMPPEDQAALLTRYEPEGEGFAFEAERFTALQKALAEDAKRREDPARYVLQYSPDLQGLYQAATAPNAPADAMDHYVEASLNLQERAGIADPHILSTEHAAAIVAGLKDPKPTQDRGAAESMADSMQGLALTFGKHWGSVYGELLDEGLPPEFVVLATTDDPRARVMLAEAFMTDPVQQRAAIGTDNAKLIDQAVADALSDFNATFAYSPNGVQVTAAYAAAAQQLAYSYARRMSPADAARAAVEAVATGGRQFIDDDGYLARVPADAPLDRVLFTADQALASLTETQIGDPGGMSEPVLALTAQERRQAYLDSILQSHLWITNEDESGLVLLDGAGNPVTRADGSRLEIRFDALLTPPPRDPVPRMPPMAP